MEDWLGCHSKSVVEADGQSPREGQTPEELLQEVCQLPEDVPGKDSKNASGSEDVKPDRGEGEDLKSPESEAFLPDKTNLSNPGEAGSPGSPSAWSQMTLGIITNKGKLVHIHSLADLKVDWDAVSGTGGQRKKRRQLRWKLFSPI